MGINLKTSDSKVNKEKIRFGKVLPVVVFLLFLVVASYVALLFLSKNTETKIEATQERLNQKTEEFKNGDAKNVLDFQNRISESNKLLDNYVDNLAVLDEIQKRMLPGVFLDNLIFNHESGEIFIDCRTSDYSQVSKQILSFKKSDFFSEIDAGKTSVLEREGLIGFEIILKFSLENFSNK